MVFNALTTDEVQNGVDRIVGHLGSPGGFLDEAQRAQLRLASSIERYLRVEREVHQRLVAIACDKLTVIIGDVDSSEARARAQRVAKVADSTQLGEVIADLLEELRMRGTEGALINRIHEVLREAVDRENDAMAEAPR